MSNSSIRPMARVDLGVMAMKEYSTFFQSPNITGTSTIRLFRVISRTLCLREGVLPSAGMQLSVFYSPSWLGNAHVVECKQMYLPTISCKKWWRVWPSEFMVKYFNFVKKITGKTLILLKVLGNLSYSFVMNETSTLITWVSPTFFHTMN